MFARWTFIVLVVAAVSACAAAETPRIVGGSGITVETHPFIVQVESNSVLFWGQSCSGTIITSSVVLSSAQCFIGTFFSVDNRRIRAGATRRGRGGVVISVRTVTNHPNYNRATNEADLSVIRLASAFIYSKSIQRAAIIAFDYELPSNLPVTELGWGSNRPNGNGNSNDLRHTLVYTVDHEVCAKRYAQLTPRRVSDAMLCTGVMDVDGYGACDGDEGGPVVYDNIVVGVISWRHTCGNGTLPAVNTKVATFTNWIVIMAS